MRLQARWANHIGYLFVVHETEVVVVVDHFLNEMGLDLDHEKVVLASAAVEVGLGFGFGFGSQVTATQSKKADQVEAEVVAELLDIVSLVASVLIAAEQ